MLHLKLNIRRKISFIEWKKRYLQAWLIDETLIIRADGAFFIKSKRRFVNRKWPRWLTAKWISYPSTDFPDAIITPKDGDTKITW